MKRRHVAFTATIVLGALACAPPAMAQEFSLTPYVWLPNIDGSLRFDIPPGLGSGSSAEVEAGPNDYLENLDMALMLAGEAKFRGGSVFTDIIYLDFSNENGSVRTINGPGPVEIPIDIGTQLNFKGLEWTLGAGLDLVDHEGMYAQVFAGMRYLGPEAQLNWSLDTPNRLPATGSITQESEIWDGLIGLRGEGRIGDWIFPYYFDIGAGSSDLTWQALAGAGYSFGGWDLHATYRHLAYEQADDELLQGFAFSGPAFGATFRF